MASYNLFNYNHRPAKTVERKIFIELLKEIYGVVDARHCTYIGFGSPFFVDFRMIHKELGIKRMINIENKTEDQARFEFNKPFSCIQLCWGNSTDVLIDIDWNGKKIIWLDYDETLKTYMLEDVDIIFSNIEPGSFYFYSCNSSLPRFYDKVNQVYKVDEFKQEFGDYVPFDLTSQMLTGSQSPFLIRRMVFSRINHILEQRNAILDDGNKLVYNQMFLLTYRDRAPMISTGGIVTTRSESESLNKSKVLSLPYVRTRDQVLDIESPVLTNSEIDLINTHLPKAKSRFLKLKKLKFIPEQELEKYYSIYRYYPSFVEIRDF